MKCFPVIFLLMCSLASSAQDTAAVNIARLNHELWDKLLQAHVDSLGQVDYAGFVADSAELNMYLDELRSARPDTSTWSRAERMAFWINAYNAFTVQLIVRNYPCKSIKDLAGSLYKVNTPWDIRFIRIADKTYDLNNIEHDILRREFHDPRIHFALNCASISCPVLRREAYRADRLEEQLNDQASRFINDGTRNKITAKSAKLSRIFSWYQGDFTQDMKLIAFINQFSNVKMDVRARIEYLEYDWRLNEAMQ